MPALTFSMKTPCQQPSFASCVVSVLQAFSEFCTLYASAIMIPWPTPW